MVLNEVLDRNVRCYPEAEAIVYEGRRYSYRDLSDRVSRMAGALMDLRVRKGDRVALLAKNSLDYLVNYFGIIRAGAVVVPLNHRLAGSECEYIINHSDTRCLIFGEEFSDLVRTIRPALKGTEWFIMMGGAGQREGLLSYEELMDRPISCKPGPVAHEQDVAVQMYTSGTTGRPKGAMLTHKNLVAASFMGIVALQITSEGRSLVVAPLFHIAALVLACTTMLVGGTIVLMEEFDPAEVLRLFGKERITHGFFVPAMLKMLLDVPGVEDHDYSSLRTLGFGGAPISYDLLTACRRTFKCDLMQGFGQTETASCATNMSQEEYRRIAEDPGEEHKLRSVGKDLPGIHVRIVDDEGRDVQQGEVGEIVLRGDNVMIGYYKMPEETEEVLRGGWLHTGDMGKFDGERYLYIVDRKKDMIISGGENIYSQEIENVIANFDGVADVAVVGIPDDKWGEVPRAFVVRSPGADFTEEALIAFCRENLAGFKCPKSVVFLDVLPRNAAGKVLKRKLRGHRMTTTDRKNDHPLRKAESSQTNEELAEYYDAWAPHYEEDSLRFGYHRVVAVVTGLVRRHVEKEGARILDAGAGTGMLGDILALLGYKDLVAVDMSHGMLEQARRKGVYSEIHRMLIDQRMDFPAGTFSAVVAMGVFTGGCHIPPEAFREFIRITKPGGHIVLTLRTETPTYGSYKRMHDALAGEGKWRLVEATRPFQSLPFQNPEALLEAKVFRVL